jgi:hypothetical protein
MSAEWHIAPPSLTLARDVVTVGLDLIEPKHDVMK